MSRKAFTLVEMLVALAIMSLLVTGGYGMYDKSAKICRVIREGINVRKTGEMMIRTMVFGERGKEGLIQAVSIDSIDTADFDNIIFTDKEGTQVIFYLADGTVYKQVESFSPVDLDINDLVEITDFSLTYLNVDEDSVVSFSDVTKVKITLTLKGKSRGSVTIFTLHSAVRPRNLYKL